MENEKQLLREAFQYRDQRDWGRAEDCCQRILGGNPQHADALHLLGVLQSQQGRKQAAIETIARAVTLAPKASYLHNLGQVQRDLGNLAASVRSFQAALDAQPDLLATAMMLGETLADADRLEESEKALRKAAERVPTNPKLLMLLASVCERAGRLPEAVTTYRSLVQLEPENSAHWSNLGSTLMQQDRVVEAVECLRRAQQIAPRDADIHFNLGNALSESDQTELAIEAYDLCLEISPQHIQAHNNRAGALRQRMQLTAAEEGYTQALALEPDNAKLHWGRALVWLMSGDLKNGFAEYQWRWQLPEQTPRMFDVPRWDGTPLAGETILLHAEQGLGDTIHFIRYAALVKELGGRVIVECPPSVVDLIANCDGVDQVLPQGDSLPPITRHASLLDLPYLLGTTLETIPAKVPYLVADPDRSSPWREALTSCRGLKIGVAWQGNPDHQNDRRRSFHVREIEPLAKVAGIDWISLQKGYGAEQLASAPFDLKDPTQLHANGLATLADTAALVANLDLVITCDSAVAHLAGALGVPVWVAIPFEPDWRWMADRDDSPWYPTMRLYRQDVAGDWDDVFARMADDLQTMAPKASIDAPSLVTGAKDQFHIAEPRMKRALVLSCLNVGNFGDRLGFHLLNQVLPPDVEVTHACFDVKAGFRLPEAVNDHFDVTILGIGNSVFAPLLTDQLLQLVAQSRRAVGIFGTQYHAQIDAPCFRQLVDRLDVWFARYQEDLTFCGPTSAQTHHLGDWLIDAFPLASPIEDATLTLGDELWKNLPLDRTIQQIQSFRRVFSPRLHPLLCALSSAEEVAYREQRESDSAEVSGKFRAMLLDVFGREFPEEEFFTVDRNKVALYKRQVRQQLGILRQTLDDLLS